MSRRIYVDAVRNGHIVAVQPAGFHNVNLTGEHARGRVRALEETIAQVAHLKAKGLIPASASDLTISGAEFQDFRGLRKSSYQMAHRSIGAVRINGVNIAHYVGSMVHYRDVDPLKDPTLFHLLVATQAATDPIPISCNYVDSYLERSLLDPVRHLLQSVLRNQPSNRPVNTNMLLDNFIQMRSVLAYSCLAAVARHEDRLRDKGYVELQSFAAAGLTDVTDAEIDALVDGIKEGGTMAVLSEDRPSQYIYEPSVYLGVTYEITRSVEQPTAQTVAAIVGDLEAAE